MNSMDWVIYFEKDNYISLFLVYDSRNGKTPDSTNAATIATNITMMTILRTFLFSMETLTLNNNFVYIY